MKRLHSLSLAIGTSAALVLAPAAMANEAGPPAARASGDSAAASVEVAATLASGAVVLAPSAAVLVAGTGASLATGDPYFIEESADLAEDMLELTFGSEPLKISDETLLAPPPDVPFEVSGDEDR
ncbi:hypothetical protein [Maricaulis sp.]|uniref:hypothetical protein n=1 Tax=Maricaulis sp. TaxID=1486257 RepID=UPI002612EAAD|nr:hypothetical protein [Maricaulis sp.]